MEGFISSNSVFERELMRNRTGYANYGADKISANNSTIQRNSLNGDFSEHSKNLGAISSDDIKDALDDDFISSAINNYDKTVVDTITNDKKDKKNKIRTAIVVGGSTLLFGGISLILTRGKMTAKASKYVNSLKKAITEKITDIKSKPEISKVEELYLSALQIADKGMLRVQGTLFNISPVKDVMFEHIVRDKLGLGKVCDYITNGFKKVSLGTVKSMYKTANKDVDSMTKAFSEINKRISNGEFGVVDKTVTDKLNSGVHNIKTGYSTDFSEDAIINRSDALSEKFKGLGKKVYDSVYGNLKGFFKDTNNWSTFISERMVAEEKAKIVDNLYAKKGIISNTPKDVYEVLSESISKLEKTIIPTEKESREFVKNLREMSKLYENPRLSSKPKQREEVARDIFDTISDYISVSDKIDPSQKVILESMKKTLSSDKKGLVEELLTIYKKVLPQDEYKKLKLTVNKATQSLNKAVYNEGNNYTDKMRDLSVGSALTDVAIGTAVPILGTGIAISAADTKEKKRSVLLKFGIPLMVGLATTTTCAIRLISGGKALILGALTSTITNNICERIDNKLRNKTEQNNNIE